MKEELSGLKEIGWREWLALPALTIPAIKAKVDTGAKTSALHTFELETFQVENQDYVRFKIHPLQKNSNIIVHCESKIIDQRQVKDSGGHSEERYIISTPVVLGNLQWDIEISLTSREDMIFRMLLGRTAISQQGLCVNPAKSYLSGKDRTRIYENKKQKGSIK